MFRYEAAMHRLFVAATPPASVRADLSRLMAGVAGARWQADEQLHITLRFVGEVERPVAEDVAAALGAVHAPACAVALSGVGRFEKNGRANAIWAGLSPAEGLAHLHRKIDQALVRIGLPPEGRAYLPHVTLARFARTAGAGVEIERWLAEHAGLSSAPFAITHFALFESHLGSEGADYRMVERWALD